ncbi:MAG: hypothetical protein AABY18_02970 [Candidatus Thermoplasmatota archaeon]
MRVVLAVTLLTLAALLAAVPPAQAQQPGPTAKVLWAHGAAPAEGETLWANFDKEDPEATDTANGPGYNCVAGSVPFFGPALCPYAPMEGDLEHTFTLPMDPALAVPLEFTDTTLTANLFFGANSGAGEGQAIVRLKAGESVVAESAAIPFSYDQGYAPASGPVAIQQMSVPAGAELVWEIEVTGSASGFFMGIHDDTGKSHLVLPLGSGSPAVEALSGAAVDIQRTFNESTNQTLRFTWVGPATAQAIAYTTNGTGSATFVVLDAGNNTLLNETAQGSKTGSKTINGTAGNWSISIALAGFNGTLRLTINDPSVTPGPPGATPGTSTGGTTSKGGSATGAAGNGTDDEGDGKKDTPVPALPALLGAVIAALAVARRRR